MDKSIFDKIKKCLRLASSNNEHEAAAALRQAHKLMELHGITESDVEASMASEQTSTAGVKATPSLWESTLATCIGNAFGCRTMFTQLLHSSQNGKWSFIGCGSAPEVAKYAFDVLSRQLRRGRAEYIKTNLRRCKKTSKTRRADLYCAGWAMAVQSKVDKFANTETQDRAIQSYMNKTHGELSVLEPRDRNEGRTLSLYEHSNYVDGSKAGKDAYINHGVNGAQQQGRLEFR
jgi:hypothetical protein